MQEGSLFSTPPPSLVICGHIIDSHSGWCEVVSRGSFDLHFSNNLGLKSFYEIFLVIKRVFVTELNIFFP